MAQGLQFGLDVGIYGRLATHEHILELAELAEASGLESIWVADHVIFPATVAPPYPYSASGTFPVDMTQEPLLEPVATMGVLVGATRRVKIGTAVLIMPYRNPVLLARMLITLDVLSAGRMLLGVGVGWLAEEFAALDARPFAARRRPRGPRWRPTPPDARALQRRGRTLAHSYPQTRAQRPSSPYMSSRRRERSAGQART
jgi:alkanesulfonate monooxygenase SsuD/methylene tetrahydromethanopterin reductase-like flavin-dependent oxidoreductase (luciferase family)